MESLLTFHCRGGYLQITPHTFPQCPSYHSTHRRYISKKITRPFAPCARKLWLTVKPRQNVSIIRAASEDNNGADEEEEGGDFNEKKEGFTWNRVRQAFGRGAQRFYQNVAKDLKKETGIDVGPLNEKVLKASRELRAVAEPYRQKSEESLERFAFELWPLFVAWNRPELWKDFKHWESKRIGALVLYFLFAIVSSGGLYLAFRRPRLNHETINKLAESYLEASIPDPSPMNVRKLKKELWRRYMPEGLKVRRYSLGRDGHYHEDNNYFGQDAWEDNTEPLPSELKKAIDKDIDSNDEEKKELQEPILGASGGSGNAATKGTWQEKLAMWDRILEKEKVEDDIDALTSKYAISFNWQEVKENFQKQQEQKRPNTQHKRGVWFSKRWWLYRPKLPYTYFLLKVECLEVEAVAFSDDFERIYVTMKEGFPSEYIVDIPVDPYLLDMLTRCGVEVDTINTIRQIRLPWLRAVVVLAPGIFALGCIFCAYRAVQIMSLYQVSDMLREKPEMIFAPDEDEGTPKTGYKDVVLGGDMWDVLDEIMMYMKNPMKYHNKGVKLPRGILISGPPGTGKTHFARAMARESGIPFAFASGAEFTSSGQDSASKKMFDLFFTARANAPAFVFIDEVDAVAGKKQLEDPVRKDVYETLLAQLDAEIEHTSVDRYDLRQAVVLLCATNRPDELDNSFIQLGRIDRQIRIGLPGEKERVEIFAIHSAGKRLAKDVNFEKIVFRTVGYSGADIRNLVNEAGIMAIKKGHKEIFQQDITDVLDKQLFESMGLLMTEEEQRMYERKVPIEDKRLLAVHEAGHMLLAHLLPQFDWHAFTYLLPGGKGTAWSLFYPREEMLFKGYPTVGYLKMQMVVAHGGRCAEQIVFGDDITDGGQDDLLKISRIARELVISPANPRLGLFPMTWSSTFEYPIPGEVELMKNEWEDPKKVTARMSVEVSELFTREATRYIEETEEEAKVALMKNRHILDRLAAELFERTKLTGLEVEKIVSSMNPVMLDDPMKMPDMNLDKETKSPPNGHGFYEGLDIFPAPLHRC